MTITMLILYQLYPDIADRKNRIRSKAIISAYKGSIYMFSLASCLRKYWSSYNVLYGEFIILLISDKIKSLVEYGDKLFLFWSIRRYTISVVAPFVCLLFVLLSFGSSRSRFLLYPIVFLLSPNITNTFTHHSRNR